MLLVPYSPIINLPLDNLMNKKTIICFDLRKDQALNISKEHRKDLII